MKPLRTEPEASIELEEAALWYEGKRAGLGLEFLEAINSALDFVTRFTPAGSSVPFVSKDLAVRRAPVRRFPFHVVYLEPPRQSESWRLLMIDVDRATGSPESDDIFVNQERPSAQPRAVNSMFTMVHTARRSSAAAGYAIVSF